MKVVGAALIFGLNNGLASSVWSVGGFFRVNYWKPC